MSYIFGQADWFYGINKPPVAYQCPPGHTQITSVSGVKCIPPTPVAPVIAMPGVPGQLLPPLEEPAEIIYEEEDVSEDETKIFYQNMIIVGGGIAIMLALMLAIKQIV